MRAGIPLVLTLLLAGCVDLVSPAATLDPASLPAVPLVDPLAEGALPFAWEDYDAGTVEVGGPDAEHKAYSYDARLRGRVWWPEPAGAYPTLVLLHGQHNTCQLAGEETLFFAIDDCSDDEGLNTPYPNHLGYEYLATHLAAHGYVVVSILGYEVNRFNDEGTGEDVGMWARGELLLATLDAIRARAAGFPPAAAERADLDRVGLMGHSRGGEGVVTTVHVNLARPEEQRHAVRGIVALAPTDFNERGVPDVPLLSLVPYCDGDVYSLHGLRTYDHSRLLDDATAKVQVLVRGANHNYYNSRWYDDVGAALRPGDDAMFNLLQLAGSCGRERDAGGARFTPLETQRESLVHVGGFLRWTAGGEAGLAPHFTGKLALPDAACAGCADAVVVTAQLPGAHRLAVVDGSIPRALRLDGFDDARVCSHSGCAPTVYSSADALDLRWSGDASITLAFDAPQDWRAMDAFLFRGAVPAGWSPDLPGYAVRIEVEDAHGAHGEMDAREVSTALEPTPDVHVDSAVGPFGTSKVALQAVRVPLADLGIDLAQVTEVRILFGGEGRALVADLYVQPEPDVLI